MREWIFDILDSCLGSNEISALMIVVSPSQKVYLRFMLTNRYITDFNLRSIGILEQEVSGRKDAHNSDSTTFALPHAFRSGDLEFVRAAVQPCSGRRSSWPL